MRFLGKFLLGILFTFLLLIFILLGTFRFEILNRSFLFWSFERHQVYEKLPQVLAQSLPNDPEIPEEERVGYAQIAQSIKPETSRKFIQSTFGQIIGYVNGDSNDVNISIPAREIGIGKTDINWSLSELKSRPPQEGTPPNSGSSFDFAYGLGNKILIAWFATAAILIGLFFIYGRLTKPKSVWDGKTLLLVGGLVVTLLGAAARLFSLVMEKNMPEKLEPSQALLKLLASSLFPDITISWIIIGILLLTLWLVIRKVK